MPIIWPVAIATTLARVLYHLAKKPPPVSAPASQLREVASYYERVPIARITAPQCAWVVGEIAAQGELRAPLSGRPCVWWRVRIDRLEGGAWHRRAAYQLGGCMKLSDGSGTCLIDPSEAELELDTTMRTVSRLRDLAPAQVRALADIGYQTWELTPRSQLRLTETTIAASQRIAVAGVAHVAERPDGERDYRSAPPRWPVFAGEILVASSQR